MSRNLHKYYYKDYFGEKPEEIIDPGDNQNRRKISASLDWMNIKTNKANPRILKKRNTGLTQAGLLYKIEKPVHIEDTFELEIIYPGLVTGIGINHEATIEGEFKLGVHFDWTYGMPVVYGSSVKGVLRAWFKEFYDGNRDSNDYEIEIFEGKLRDIEAEKKKYGQEWEEKVKTTKNRIYIPKSIYDRDIFFDAVIVEAEKEGKGRILCSDSITPHGENPLKNPTPITFMKIAPGCKLQFRFKLVGNDEEKELKRNLFKEILTTVGIGAKTNVGYGQLK
jgi:CRISPR-associated protein Cmr6